MYVAAHGQSGSCWRSVWTGTDSEATGRKFEYTALRPCPLNFPSSTMQDRAISRRKCFLSP